MSQLLEDLGLDNASWDDDDRDLKLAGAIPEGRYHARLTSAAEKAAGEFVLDELKFEILHGPYKGKVIEEDLFHSGKDDDKTKKAKVKRRTYYHRLGLLTKSEVNGEKKYALAPGKHHIRDCIGAEVIIDVKVADEKWTDKKTGEAKSMKKNRLAYIGVFKLDDPEVANVPRATGPRPPVESPPNLDDL